MHLGVCPGEGRGSTLNPSPSSATARPVVSVVIVCMNQMERLRTCLDSLFAQNTRVPFETWVVAYRFSPDNLRALRREYPGVLVVESTETRGFSENNNLALRQARGQFCFLLNDDTRMEMPVLDLLAESFGKQPDAAIFMPKILDWDGSYQFCGAPRPTLLYGLLRDFRLLRRDFPSRYVNQPGIFRTRAILGAAFMVRTDVLRELGYLDERYFFAPEDTALSTLADERGYPSYVNADVEIFHAANATLKAHYLPVMAAMQAGHRLFFSRGRPLRMFWVSLLYWLRDFIHLLFWCFRRGESARLHRKMWRMMAGTAFSRATPKELFLRYSGAGAEEGRK